MVSSSATSNLGSTLSNVNFGNVAGKTKKRTTSEMQAALLKARKEKRYDAFLNALVKLKFMAISTRSPVNKVLTQTKAKEYLNAVHAKMAAELTTNDLLNAFNTVRNRLENKINKDVNPFVLNRAKNLRQTGANQVKNTPLQPIKRYLNWEQQMNKKEAKRLEKQEQRRQQRSREGRERKAEREVKKRRQKNERERERAAAKDAKAVQKAREKSAARRARNNAKAQKEANKEQAAADAKERREVAIAATAAAERARKASIKRRVEERKQTRLTAEAEKEEKRKAREEKRAERQAAEAAKKVRQEERKTRRESKEAAKAARELLKEQTKVREEAEFARLLNLGRNTMDANKRWRALTY